MAKKKVSKVVFSKIAKSLVKENKTVEFQGIEFEVKPYLPIEEKLLILELVLENCFTEIEETGVKFYNEPIRNFMLEFFICQYYTNLDVKNDDIMKSYDLLCESGMLEFIMNEIETEELDWYEDNLESRIFEQQSVLERENQFGNILKSLLNKLEKSLPEMMKTMENFDPQKLQFLQQMSANLNKKGVVQ